jgi:hypothetical protein
MNYKILVFLMGLALLLQNDPLRGTSKEENEEGIEEIAQESSESYVLPLSYEEDAALLVIPLPQHFKMAYNGSTYPDVLYLQFIPHNETINYWSELITICQSTELLDAHEFIKTFKNVIEETQSLESYPNYTSYIRCGLERGIKVGYYVSEHPSINPHQIGIQAPRYMELLKVKTVQAEDRVWVIQYALRYDPLTITDEQLDELVEKMHDFFKTCKVSSNVTGSPI